MRCFTRAMAFGTEMEMMESDPSITPQQIYVGKRQVSSSETLGMTLIVTIILPTERIITE